MTSKTKLIILTIAIGLIGVYAYQWKTHTDMQTDLMAGSIDFLSYYRPVNQFVNENQRWPEAEEIQLRTPPEVGVVKKVELLEEGKIALTLSAWSLFDGHANVTLAPIIQDEAARAAFGPSLVRFQCLDVQPKEMAPLICRSLGEVTEAELKAANKEGFAGVRRRLAAADEKLQAFNAAVKAAEAAKTQCDVIWQQAQTEVIPCMEAQDPEQAANFKQRTDKTLNGLRLNGETIVRNPDALQRFNRQCESNWRSLVGIYRSSFSSCFE